LPGSATWRLKKQRSQSQGSKAHDLYYAIFIVVVAAIINICHIERVQVWLGGGVPEGDVVISERHIYGWIRSGSFS
jgi:hypothetical protein